MRFGVRRGLGSEEVWGRKRFGVRRGLGSEEVWYCTGTVKLLICCLVGLCHGNKTVFHTEAFTEMSIFHVNYPIIDWFISACSGDRQDAEMSVEYL
jgi:hypothetical protein